MSELAPRKEHEEFGISADSCSDDELRMMMKLLMEHLEIEMVESRGYGQPVYRLAKVER